MGPAEGHGSWLFQESCENERRIVSRTCEQIQAVSAEIVRADKQDPTVNELSSAVPTHDRLAIGISNSR